MLRRLDLDGRAREEVFQLLREKSVSNDVLAEEVAACSSEILA